MLCEDCELSRFPHLEGTRRKKTSRNKKDGGKVETPGLSATEASVDGIVPLIITSKQTSAAGAAGSSGTASVSASGITTTTSADVGRPNDGISTDSDGTIGSSNHNTVPDDAEIVINELLSYISFYRNRSTVESTPHCFVILFTSRRIARKETLDSEVPDIIDFVPAVIGETQHSFSISSRSRVGRHYGYF